MSTQLPPSGWQSDPERPGHQRWWDGAGWSDHRRRDPSPPSPAESTRRRGGVLADLAEGTQPPTRIGSVSTGSHRLDRMLLPDERVIVSASMDPGLAYFPAIAVGVAAMLTFVVLASGGNPGRGLQIAVSLMFFIGAPLALVNFLQLKTNHFAMTDRRALVTTGILSMTTREILLGRIEGISVSQTLLDRPFKAGTIVVSGVGVGNVHIRGVEAAYDVRLRVASWLESQQPSG